MTMLWIALIVLALVVGFVVGLLVGRRNPSIANVVSDTANKAEAAAKSVTGK